MKRKILKNAPKIKIIYKIKYIKMIDKVHVYMCLHTAMIKSIAGKKTMLSLSPFLVSTSWFLILAKAFRNGYVVLCGTARCSAAEKKEISGHRAVPFLAKMTQHSSTAD